MIDDTSWAAPGAVEGEERSPHSTSSSDNQHDDRYPSSATEVIDPPDEADEPEDLDEPDEPSDGLPRTFEEMNLDPEILQALADMGYEAPMKVQAAIYQHAMTGRDLMVESRTGTGKTAAFGIPIAQLLGAQSKGAQSLILAPTRELALQVANELQQITKHKTLRVVPVYGGAPMKPQINALQAGAQIVVGTPGRILDHIRRRTLDTKGIRLLVLDECDEMLSMGFQEEIENILEQLPPKDQRQTLLFSATIPPDIERIGKRHMREWEKISLSADGISVAEIDHHYYLVSGMARTRDLLKIMAAERPESAIIFCNTREDTNTVAKFLQRSGYDAEAISSDLSQRDRERVMKRMRDRSLRFLVATDIAARGIDISDLTHVINYSFPESPEVYVHRTGRTGRAGKTGTAISLVGPREIGAFYYLKLIYRIRPQERELPTAEELATLQEGEKYEQVVGMVPEQPSEQYVSLARRMGQSLEGERVIAALLQRLLTQTARPQLPAPTPPPRREPSEQVVDEENDVWSREGGDRPDRPPRDRDRGRGGRDRDRGGRGGGGGGRDRDRMRGRDRDRSDRGGPGRDRDRERGDRDRERTSDRDRERGDRESSTEIVPASERLLADRSDPALTEDSLREAAERQPREAAERQPRESGERPPRESGERPPRERERERELSRREPRDGMDEGRPRRRRRRRRDEGDEVGLAGEPTATEITVTADPDDPTATPVVAPRPAPRRDDGPKEFWEAWAEEKAAAEPVARRAARPREDGEPERERRPSRLREDGEPERERRPRDRDRERDDDLEDLEDGSIRLYVNIGKREKATSDDIRQLVANILGDDASIQSVAIRNTHSYVRLAEDLADRVIDGARGRQFAEREVVIERAKR